MAQHDPVMVRETVAHLLPQPGGLFIDFTVGLGGHTKALLEAGASRVIAIDRDREALAAAAEVLAPWSSRVDLVHADYREFERVLDERGVAQVDGAVADLGISSLQLDSAARGFSFRHEGALDMRMDQTRGETAADVVASASEEDLANVIFQLGEERYSRRIARAIAIAREHAPITTTSELASIVRRAIPRHGHARIDPATRTFQALRIRVNHELDALDTFLRSAIQRLRAEARLVVISFHSLEDRIVKHTFRALERGADAAIRVLTKRPLVPGEEERARNPRARSAKLRVAEKLA